MKKILLALSLITVSLIGEPLQNIMLDGNNGHYYDTNKPWNSSMLKGKTTMLMYVDPDEKGKGEIFKPTIEAFERDLDFDKFQILVILNLKATWKPNALIKKLMKSKLTDYPKRIYVLDYKSVLVKRWGLTNDEYNTLVINNNEEVIYSHSGSWKDGEISKIDSLIRLEVKN